MNIPCYLSDIGVWHPELTQEQAFRVILKLLFFIFKKIKKVIKIEIYPLRLGDWREICSQRRKDAKFPVLKTYFAYDKNILLYDKKHFAV